MKFSSQYLLSAIISCSLIASSIANAQSRPGLGNGNPQIGSGNNGNGVGNTGPGNQGNTTLNGNAGGSLDQSQGNNNGASQGGGNQNTNTGGYNGGNNGNGVGNTGPGNQGNDTPNGNAGGGTVTGGTTGGSTGAATGGTDGGSTGGSTGGTTGGTDGGSTGGTTGGNSHSAPSAQIKARVLPLAFGHYDVINKIVNLTQDMRDIHVDTPVILDHYTSGFQFTYGQNYQVGLGIAPQLYLVNVAGLAGLATGLVGLAPIKGKSVVYDRYVMKKQDLYNLTQLPLPYSIELFDNYNKGDSVYFENSGGLLFSGMVSLGAYVGGAIVTQGSYGTLVTKLEEKKALVQIKKSSLKKATLYTGLAVINLDTSTDKSLSQTFTYTFDFNTGSETIQAYEELLAGNAMLAQSLADKGSFTGVVKIDSLESSELRKSKKLSVGLPMIAIYSWMNGKVYGESETLFHGDNSKTDLNYGIFFKEENGRFFHNHKQFVRAFYSGDAVKFDKQGTKNSSEKKSTYLWRFENDSSKSSKLTKAIKTLNKDLGLSAAFRPIVKDHEKLGFIRLEAQVEMDDAFTSRLIQFATDDNQNDKLMKTASHLMSKYFEKGDQDELCLNDDDEVIDANDFCYIRLEKETRNALSKIKFILRTMKNANTAKDFTGLHAQMGKELVKNQFVLGTVFALDEKCELNYLLKFEGERVSRIQKKIAANPNCR